MSVGSDKIELKHIAFIPDGNRRWAKNKHLHTLFGHKYGFDIVKQLAVILPKYGIKYATFFCFSTENWQRSEEEVSYLMDLFENLFDNSDNFFTANGVKVKVVGDLSRLPDKVRNKVLLVEENTKNNNVITLIGAVSYSGRDEIVRTTKKIVQNVIDGKMSVDKINELTFSEFLDCPGIPDPDIIVRTSEKRISNFLLWQLAYSEIMFIDKFWPDFSEDDLKYIIEDFSRRKRRYGK